MKKILFLFFSWLVIMPTVAMDFTGWWGMTLEGCFDEDNQYRVALGRWDKGNEGIKFGVGQEKVGLYDSECILSNRVENQNIVTYLAICYDEEGEKYEGAGKIILEDEFTARVFMPILLDEGLSLVRCTEKEANNISDKKTDGVSYTSEDKTLVVRGGKLTVVGESGSGEQKLLLDSKKLRDSDGFSLSFEQKYSIGDKDIVLMMNNSGGTACPVQYFFVSVNSQGNAKLSPEFGTCSDLAKPAQNGSKITVTMPKMTGRGNAKYVYENDTIFENGKAIKDVSLPPKEEGEVLINDSDSFGGHPSRVWPP